MKNVRPGVGKYMLMTLAGMLWLFVGTMLVRYAIHWYSAYNGSGLVWFIMVGILSGLVIHHLGFLRIVNKNLSRIQHIEQKYCIFGFMSWKSYILIAVMMTMGIILRNSPLPRIYLSILYMGIGLALVLSSIRYFRHAIFDQKKSHLK
ncbi:MAG: hypothetical protein KAH17_03860 [Bacteroidales bacterium]|nr:hypothetical protein [Bacteroidales bacterium]